MAKNLGINRCWFHNGGNGKFPHYDIPKKMIDKLSDKTELVSSRDIIYIIKESK